MEDKSSRTRKASWSQPESQLVVVWQERVEGWIWFIGRWERQCVAGIRAGRRAGAGRAEQTGNHPSEQAAADRDVDVTGCGPEVPEATGVSAAVARSNEVPEPGDQLQVLGLRSRTRTVTHNMETETGAEHETQGSRETTGKTQDFSLSTA